MTLRDLRVQAGKTRAEVAEAIGVTVSAVSHYENGKREINIRQILVLAKLYDCTAEEIIEAQLRSGVKK